MTTVDPLSSLLGRRQKDRERRRRFENAKERDTSASEQKRWLRESPFSFTFGGCHAVSYISWMTCGAFLNCCWQHVFVFRIGKKRSLSYHGRHHRTILKEPALFVPDFKSSGN